MSSEGVALGFDGGALQARHSTDCDRVPDATRFCAHSFAVEVNTSLDYPSVLMTLTEKILARAAGKARVQAGENVWVKADVLLTHDGSGPGPIGALIRQLSGSEG